jgi:hypothetical protein
MGLATRCFARRLGVRIAAVVARWLGGHDAAGE